MHSFLYPPRQEGVDEEDYVDPDIVEPVFFPEAVQIIVGDEEDDDEEVDEQEHIYVYHDDDDEHDTGNMPLSTVSEATQFILTGVLEEANQTIPQLPTILSQSVEFIYDVHSAPNTPEAINGANGSQSPGLLESDVPTTPSIPEVHVEAKEQDVADEAKSPGTETTEEELCLTNKRHRGSPDSTPPQPKRLLLMPDEDSQFQSDNESYSNPLASAEEVDGIDDEAFRGDRIGDTTYSERHVLKILMKWIEELPKYSDLLVNENGTQVDGEENEDCDEKKLERVFKKEMSLLWDMSSEQDVMLYLVDKGIFGIIRDSLMSSRCNRLTEISLGILANILSCAEMSKKLAEEDARLKLLETVVSVGCGTTEVAILLQVFAVLRRVTWYMHHVSPVEPWISSTVDSPPFLSMLTLILKGSTHAVLIKDAVMVVYFLLETLIRTPEGSDNTPNPSCNASEQIDDRVMVLATEPIVASLCEGLQELLKVRDDEEAVCDLIDEARVVPHHIQLALRSGVGALCFIQKLPAGQETLRKEKTAVSKFVSSFLVEFVEVTSDLERGQALEYLVAAMSLLAVCYIEYEEFQAVSLLCPVAAAQKLIEGDVDDGIVDSLSIAFQEHIAQLGRKFGMDGILTAIEKTDAKTIAFLKPIGTAVVNTFATEELAGGL